MRPYLKKSVKEYDIHIEFKSYKFNLLTILSMQKKKKKKNYMMEGVKKDDIYIKSKS